MGFSKSRNCLFAFEGISENNGVKIREKYEAGTGWGKLVREEGQLASAQGSVREASIVNREWGSSQT
jgi:hypothetical protein